MCYTGKCKYEGYNGECDLNTSHCPEEEEENEGDSEC